MSESQTRTATFLETVCNEANELIGLLDDEYMIRIAHRFLVDDIQVISKVDGKWQPKDLNDTEVSMVEAHMDRINWLNM